MCDFPITIKNSYYRIPGQPYHLDVPCGKCATCLKKRANAWALRLYHEQKRQYHADFITLTYADAPRSYNGLYTTVKADLQKFFKRLRKHETKQKITYYACSEYGEKGQRPHYHAIVFGVEDKRSYLKSWEPGLIDVTDVTPASIRYVTGYIEKRIGIPLDDYDDREKEFSVMSKHLGENFLYNTKLWNADHQEGFTMYQGKKQNLPRYYKDKLWPDVFKKELIIDYTDPSKRKFKVHKTKIFNHPVKQKINEENIIIHDQITMAKTKNFNSVQDFESNQRQISERNNYDQSALIIQTKI